MYDYVSFDHVRSHVKLVLYVDQYLLCQVLDQMSNEVDEGAL